MDHMRFKIIFDKVEEEERKAGEDARENELNGDDGIESNEIAELRRIVLETTESEPFFFTST